MILTFILAFAPIAHPLSVSSSRVVVDGAHVELELRCQALTLVECLQIDTNGDRRTSQDEIDAARDTIARYVLDGYRITAGVDDAGRKEQLVGRLESARVRDGSVTGSSAAEQLVDCVFRFEASAPLRTLHVDFTLFRAADPLHRDHAQIEWNGRAPDARVLWVEDPAWNFEPSAAPRGVFVAFVSLGIEHILTGYDHIAFVIALVVGSRRLRSILGVVTAFTLAHSITLALASMGYVHVPSNIVEPAIAASIAYVAVRNLSSRGTRSLWPEAFGFGLIHGLGFAGSIAETLASETQKLLALVGFNAGVEFGQLGVVTAIVILLALSSRASKPESAETATLAPRWVRIGASSIVAVLGAYWFAARVFG